MKDKGIIGILLLVIILLFSSCTTKSMENLPEGEFIGESCSPNQTHKIRSYLVSGNATVDFSVRCELVEISSGKTRNIYWKYHCETVDIKWIDDTVVEINKKRLNVLTDSYDWRQDGDKEDG